MPAEPRPARDRDALIAAALVVAAVVIVARVVGLVPALEDAVGLAPVVIAFLIGVTVFVLVRTLRPRR